MKRVVGRATLHLSTFKSVSPGAEANAPTPGHWFRYEAALGVIDPEITCSNCLECSRPDPFGRHVGFPLTLTHVTEPSTRFFDSNCYTVIYSATSVFDASLQAQARNELCAECASFAARLRSQSTTRSIRIPREPFTRITSPGSSQHCRTASMVSKLLHSARR